MEDDLNETIACPYCGADIYEDAVSCPRCGNYLSQEDAPASRRPWWIVVGALACLAVALTWVIGC